MVYTNVNVTGVMLLRLQAVFDGRDEYLTRAQQTADDLIKKSSYKWHADNNPDLLASAQRLPRSTVPAFRFLSGAE
eukprot:2949224-Amphidinium_carterae.1